MNEIGNIKSTKKQTTKCQDYGDFAFIVSRIINVKIGP